MSRTGVFPRQDPATVTLPQHPSQPHTFVHVRRAVHGFHVDPKALLVHEGHVAVPVR